MTNDQTQFIFLVSMGFVSSLAREVPALANLKDPGLAGGGIPLVRELAGDMRVLALDRIQFFNLAVYSRP